VRKAVLLRYLGNVYRGLGEYAKARSFLEQSQAIYEKAYGKGHIATARVLQDLSHLSLNEGHPGIAENLLQKALVIFQHSNHPDTYMVLENLADVSFKQAKDEELKGNAQQTKLYKTQATNYLNQALEVVKTYFPKDSPHSMRMQAKLTKN
jgi:tetratricopeptide (TPR) repeat protein